MVSLQAIALGEQGFGSHKLVKAMVWDMTELMPQLSTAAQLRITALSVQEGDAGDCVMVAMVTALEQLLVKVTLGGAGMPAQGAVTRGTKLGEMSGGSSE